MANLLLRIFLAVGACVLLMMLIGSLLPRGFDVSASTTINATPEQVFPMLNDLRQWQAWSPWNEREVKGLSVEYSDPSTGAGAVMKWTEPRGDGKLWITSTDPPESINFSHRAVGYPQIDSYIQLAVSGDSTTVTWRSSGSLPGGPFYGWTAWLFPAGYESINNF